jgi:F0F1-type ATP synthase membrane subunit c/vacuolar-type H+-ATPase subunit K
MNTQSTDASKRLLTIQWLAMLFAVGLYYGLTFMVPGEPKILAPQTKVMLGVLQVLAAVTFFLGMVVEGLLMARAVSPRNVVTNAVVSAAFGEAIAIFGLLWFFTSHERIWEFFVVSALYFVRLFVKRPDFFAKIDSFSEQ